MRTPRGRTTLAGANRSMLKGSTGLEAVGHVQPLGSPTERGPFCSGPSRSAVSRSDARAGTRRTDGVGRRARTSHRPHRARALRLCALVLGAVLGCSGAHFDGHVFRKGDVAFRLDAVPDDWRPLELTDTALAFRDEGAGATVAINGRCGKDAEDVPLRSLTQHLFLHFTERNVEQQRTFTLDEREALLSRLDAKLDGVRQYFQVVVLKKDGCVYDFLQIASQPQPEEPFLRFVNGFSSIG